MIAVADRQREAKRKWARANTAKASEIGPLPTVVDADRRLSCQRDFRKFCDVYCGPAFNLPWSDDHLKAIAKIERAVLEGGLFALAMPRSSGKTTMVQRAVVWAMLFGHSRFVCVIGATEGAAQRMLANIKMEFRFNDLLAGDFPESVYPLRSLEGKAIRCSGQTVDARQTLITWTSNQLTLPSVDGSGVSGSTVTVAGITGALRGQNHTLIDGTVIRPELVLLDDPQTRESAMSQSQSETRAQIIAGDVLGMAGPNKKIAAIMPCTVIRSGDMADRILDRKLHPQWQGERTKMVYSFPTNEKLWEQYATIRAESFRANGNGSEATKFYKENREVMDAGSVVAWAERFNDDELSALQHAMNLRLRDDHAFFAEYQNEPKTDVGIVTDLPTADEIAAKLSGIARGVAPISASHLTAFIDVQKTVLFYAVAAWSDDFTGWVIDYGIYPEQGVDYLTLREVKVTLLSLKPNAGPGGAIHAGLEALTIKLLGREWDRDDGAKMKVERCLIDAGWGESTDLVYNFCRTSPHAAVLTPSHGWGIGAAKRPMGQWTKKPGERTGHNWRMPVMADKRVVRHVIFDTNYWKSFLMAALSTPIGDKGCLSLYGLKAARHRMIADHLTAEYPVRTSGYGRSVDEWKLRVERPDNHLLDCLTACAVAASMQGVSRDTDKPAPIPVRKRAKASDMQRAKRGY